MEEHVILVNRSDEPLGIMPKLEAHKKGLLHRAFSVFILNGKGELMLQQRAAGKYHSPLLWTNTCCSHQQQGESNLAAAKRRLLEEMGFETELEEWFSFIYKAPFENGLTEHELDYIMVGYHENSPQINPEEVAAWKWVSPEWVQEDLKRNQGRYTVWFGQIFDRFYECLTDKAGKR